MKKCLFCAEEIQDEAIKCKHCGEMLNKGEQVKWYLKTSLLIIALLSIGPFALPLLWLNPRFSKKNKIIISIIVIAVTYYLIVMATKSLKTISEYYQMMFQR